MPRRAKFWMLVLCLILIIFFGPGLLYKAGVISQVNGVVSGASDPVIAAAGDIACDPTNSHFNSGNGASGACQELYTSNLLLSINPSAVLALGDTQYYCGGLQAFLQSYDPSWGRLKSITHPAVGNHEYLTSGGTDCNSANTGAAGYFNYFGAAAGTQGQGYYSFDIGTWHIIALNSNCSDAGGCNASSPQGKWLVNDLNAHPNTCTLAFWHIPLFSSGGRAAQNSLSFWQALYSHHADVVLTGHDHIYERFAPQTPTGVADPTNGIREFIVGTGGADHTTITTVAANSEVRNTNTFGVLKLTLHATSYDWSFVPEAGFTFTDSGTGICHSSTTGTATPTPTATTVISPTATRTSTPTATKTSTPTATQGMSPTATATFIPTLTPTVGTSPTATATRTPTPTVGTSPTPTATLTSTSTVGVSPSPTATPTQTSTVGISPTATVTPTPTATSLNSIVFSDGFESGDLSNWTTVLGLIVQSQEVKTGSFAARETNAGGGATYANKLLAATQTDLYYKISFKVISQAANTVNLLKFRTAANTSLLSMSINNLGRLSYRNDVAGTSVNSTIAVGQGAWQSLEVHLVIAGTTGQIEVWYNGGLVSALSNTDAFGTTPIGRVQLGENTPGLTYDIALDDVAVSTAYIP